jgi:hypothetical protein
MASLAGAVATAGLLAFAGPASASVTFMTCAPHHFSGSGTITPPFSHTNSNTSPSTFSLSATASTCAGQLTGGSDDASLTTYNPSTGRPGPANCSAFVAGSPAGSVLAKGTFTATWSNGKTSSGSAKLKSTGPATLIDYKLIEKVTSGYGFATGHVTKISATIEFTTVNGDCGGTDISSVGFDNAANLSFVQS